ncbi:MAG: hypothetical protein SOR58_08700 [Megasphaera massiliensis]|jgi:hypothetical protein|uniref:hypothetical protein n=1 Tax=Megasphaera massiliensis TaxID=1232428 RepID=UPI002A749B66|nr:hypothetical protein [Megasphaera massiliensis]MDY2966262.1 hypothetical protein [Megasphaera massiliensis]
MEEALAFVSASFALVRGNLYAWSRQSKKGLYKQRELLSSYLTACLVKTIGLKT